MSIVCTGPTDSEPDQGYGIQLWVDWRTESDRETPYTDGDVIALTTGPDTFVDNPTVIFTKPSPIPVEGDVQIFADHGCTRYADGSVATVYARVNNPWGINGSWNASGSGQKGTKFNAYAPTTQNPSDPYSIRVWEDWVSDDYEQSFTPGSVVTLEPIDGTTPATNPTVIFTKS